MLADYFRKISSKPVAGLRDQDWIIASFPKTGSTFSRFVIANVISGLFRGFEEINFYNLGEIMPEYRKDDLTSKWTYKDFPRIVKTHNEYSKEFDVVNKVIYIVRDPRDTMISYFHYMKAKKGVEFSGAIDKFVKHRTLGLRAYNLHLESWYDKVAVFLKYEELMTDAFSVFRKLFDNAHVRVDDGLLKEAIRRSSPDFVKSLELKQGRPNQDRHFKKGFVFVRNAQISQWKEVFNTKSLEYFSKNRSKMFRNLDY